MRDASRGWHLGFARGASLARDTAGPADSPNTRPEPDKSVREVNVPSDDAQAASDTQETR
jgi:hypothetical protein